jgi:GT2 family glycosyltransferase
VPDIAIVILNFNGRHLLDACLSSLNRLTTPAEVIIADNGSTDDSLAYVREHHASIRLLNLKKNWGFAEGYNRAIAQLEHPWLVLLNNDATLAPDWLEQLLSVAREKPQVAILGGKLLFKPKTGEMPLVQSAGASFTDAGTAFEIGWGQPDRGQYEQAHYTGSIPGAALLIKRDVFCELGGFDAKYFAYLEDVDLCWRAWLAGYETYYVPGAIAWHHFGASGGGRASAFRIKWMQRNRLANMLKNLEWTSLPWGFVVSCAYDLYRLVEFTLNRQPSSLRALVAGGAAFWRDLPALLAQRAAIQARRRVTDQALRERGLLVPAAMAMQEYRRLGKLKI